MLIFFNKEASVYTEATKYGAQVDEADEPSFEPCALVIFEFDAYPEAKTLEPIDLKILYEIYKSYVVVSKIIGTSECFVRQNIKTKRGNAKKTRSRHV